MNVGAAGNETELFEGGDGDDWIWGGWDIEAENNQRAIDIKGGRGNDTLYGGRWVTNSSSGQTLTGNGGEDIIRTDWYNEPNVGSVTIFGDQEYDAELTDAEAWGDPDTIRAGDGNRDGTAGDSAKTNNILTIKGGDGGDSITIGNNWTKVDAWGQNGDDDINLGFNNVTVDISGGSGEDTIIGAKKREIGSNTANTVETIKAGKGDDYVEGSDLFIGG